RKRPPNVGVPPIFAAGNGVEWGWVTLDLPLRLLHDRGDLLQVTPAHRPYGTSKHRLHCERQRSVEERVEEVRESPQLGQLDRAARLIDVSRTILTVTEITLPLEDGHGVSHGVVAGPIRQPR